MLSRAFPGVARSAHSMHEFNLARCDNLAPWPWNAVGGGNRQRRRVLEAVGPERTNSVLHSDEPSNAAWLTSNASIVGNTITFAAASHPTAYQAHTETSLDVISARVKMGTLRYVALYIGFANGVRQYFDLQDKLVLSSQNIGAAKKIAAGLEPDGDHVIIWLSATGHNSGAFIEGVGGDGNGACPGGTVDVDWLDAQAGAALMPHIVTGASPVTTTDWPRTNKASVSEGTTANLDAALHVTDAARSIDGFDNAIAIPAGNALPGTGYAYKACSFPDGTLVTVSLFVEMDDGGAPVASSSGGTSKDFMMVADGVGMPEADCVVQHVHGRLYRVTTSRVSSIAGGGNAFYGVVKYAAQSNRPCRVTGWHVRASQGVIDAYIKSGSGGTSVVTPPFGEPVTVAADQPRIEYGPDGIGRGMRLLGAAQNTNLHGENLQTDWAPPLLSQTAPLPVPSVQGGTASLIYFSGASDGYFYKTYGGLTNGVTYTWAADVQLGTASDFVVALNNASAWDTIVGSKRFTTADGLNTQYPVRVVVTFVADANAAANVHLGNHANTGLPQPSAGTVLVSNVSFVVGTRAEYIPTAGTAVTAPAECLETFNLQALDLHHGRGTILVEFVMPDVTSATARGMMSCATSSGTVYMGFYAYATQVIVQCFDGAAVCYGFTLDGFAAGDRVRAALTFDAGYFASAVNGAPGPVTYGNNPSTFDRVVVGNLVGNLLYPADTTISFAATTGRVMRLSELVERTAL